MSRLPLFFLAALPFVESPAIAAGPVAPEPAPPAQRQAPPDKIAPPMQIKSPAAKPGTTGEEAKDLKPGDPKNTRIDQSMPSSPPAANNCKDGQDKEQPGPEGRCQ
jgi:hypothetical protein